MSARLPSTSLPSVPLRLVGMLLACVALSGCSLLFGDDDQNDAADPSDTPLVLSDSPVTLSRVIDGDSLELGVAGTIEEFRFRGINAPEKNTCGSQEAADGLSQLLSGKMLTIEVDLEEPRDRFGRLLGEVQADGANVSKLLVEQGLVYPLGGSTSVLHEAALAASNARIGVWNPDRCGTGQQVLTISAFVPDPAGNDNAEGAGEFIELENVSASQVNLAGFVVRDESTSNVFTFADLNLGSGDRIRLYSTCGADTDDRRFWCSSSPVWSNIGDTALVLDPAGNTIDFRFSP